MQVYRTTKTAPISSGLRLEPLETLTLSGTMLTNEQYSSLLPQHVKMNVHDRQHHLTHKAEKVSSKALHTHKLNFNRRVRHTRHVNVD